MNQILLTEFLALALIVIVAIYLRQVPAHRAGDPTVRPRVLQWVWTFLAIWFGLQLILGLLGGIIFFMILAFQGANLTDPQTLLNEYLPELTSFSEIVNLISVVIALYVGQVAFRKQSILELGLRPYRSWGWDIAMGGFLGFIGFFLLFLWANASGQVIPNNQGAVTSDVILNLLWPLLTLIAVALSEELMIRGYVLQVMESGWGTVTAVLISSAFWGFLHLVNPDTSIAAAINIAAAGVVLAYGYLITRSLWLPIALHLSWNLFQGPIFGFPVSGLTFPSLFTSKLPGPDFVTGGGFGPEAGLVIIPILVVQVLLLQWWSTLRPKLGTQTLSAET